jgi:hypothetical protein
MRKAWNKLYANAKERRAAEFKKRRERYASDPKYREHELSRVKKLARDRKIRVYIACWENQCTHNGHTDPS